MRWQWTAGLGHNTKKAELAPQDIVDEAQRTVLVERVKKQLVK